MEVKQSGNTILTRWYSGGSFLKETVGGVTKDYTFIGGDAYTAPVVAITQSGTTTYYNLLRDHLGSITHVVNASNNTLLYEYSYDPWGRMRNVTSWTNYAPGSEPSLFVAGRGFTGHEHLPWFNLINMNGRIYDPLVGQFLSPDNQIQEPYFTQNYNRYVYCLNNPLKYNDPSGMYYEEKWIDGGTGGYRDPTSHYDYSENTYSPGSYYWKNTPHIAEWKANSNLYTYNSSGVYQNALGQTVAFNEVYYNYIVPNSEYSFSGEVAQDLISAFIQVSPSMNYTASIDGTSVDPFFKSLKLLLPVAFIMEGDLSWEAGLATSMTPGGIGIVLRGINAGTVFFYSSGGVGGGWFGAAGSINTAYFFYSGNVNKFSQYSLEGKSTVISCSAGEGASFGRSIILMKDNYGQTIIGIGTSIGAGGSPTIGSGQITIQNTHIWR